MIDQPFVPLLSSAKPHLVTGTKLVIFLLQGPLAISEECSTMSLIPPGLIAVPILTLH